MAGRDELLSQQTSPAPEFEHEPLPGMYRGKEFQDSGSAGSGVEAESAVMHDSKIVLVHGVWRAHLQQAGMPGARLPA
jgi:hypothetical protein